MLGVGREANNPTPEKILLRDLKRRLRPTQGCRADDDDDDDKLAVLFVVLPVPLVACVRTSIALDPNTIVSRNYRKYNFIYHTLCIVNLMYIQGVS
jgi:hypothetical protein